MSNHPRGKGGRSRSDSSGPGATPLSEGYTDAEVALGQVIRVLYVRERSVYETNLNRVPVEWKVPPRWDGKPQQYLDDGEPAEGGKAIGPTWPKIARVLLLNRIDPSVYVRWTFSARLVRGAPEPSHLHSDSFVSAYVNSRSPAKEREKHQMKFESQRSRAATDINYRKSLGDSERDAYLRAIVDVSNGLTPLFRYCLAVICKHAGLMDTYFPQAAVQFCRAKRDYVAVWGRHLPSGFGDRAERYYGQVCLGEVPDDAECVTE